MQQFSLPRFALAGLAFTAAAVLTLAVVAWSSARETLKAAAFVGHTHEVLSALDAAEASLFRAEAAHRAFMMSRKAIYQRERELEISELRLRVDRAVQLASDNRDQLRRLADLQRGLADRIGLYRETQALIDSGRAISIDERLDEGAFMIDALRPMFAALHGEERRLLREREDAETARSRTAGWTFAALVGVVVLLLPAVTWRLASDLRARQEAERAVDEERRYDALHNRALTFFNAEPERQSVLEKTLKLLGDTGRFPVAVFYERDEWGGALRALASRGAPADLKTLLPQNDGLIGEAAKHGRSLYLEDFDAASGLHIETGLATLRPAALMLCPVSHQGRLLGVLSLAASARLGERDRGFVERLAAQLGVALHNAGQVEGLNLLAEQLRERGEDVARKNAELERASRMKSEFLANMSHELRTPLNAVIGFSEILRDGLAGDLTAQQNEYIGDIYGSGRHLLSLINDILDLSKIEAGQMVLELDVVQPAELVASGLAVVRERAALHRVTLCDLLPAELGPLRLDARRAKQIVHNLLSNAVKFTPDGGTVTLALRSVTAADIEAVQAGDDTRLFAPAAGEHARYLEISVQDTGIGIDAKGLRELFQPFMQIDSSLSRQFEGTGLGLTMVQRLVELHGGGMMVRSLRREGSTFVVWLPWRPVETVDEPAGRATELDASVAAVVANGLAAAPIAASSDRGAILVIEDDPRAASLVKLQLEAHGFRVELAHTGERGLQQAVELLPQAVVLDVILPDMDGWNMLARLKEHAATSQIPVVICSITDEPRRGFALGAAQVLVKPVTQEDLLAALEAMGLMGETPVGRRVLVVDDDPKAVTLVCKHLEAVGFTPLAAYGGQEALDRVRRERPDAVVLDLMMPHVSGFDVVEALARDGDTADIPVLVLTAKLITAQDRDLLRGRVQRIMEKANFQPASLLAEVKRALARQGRRT